MTTTASRQIGTGALFSGSHQTLDDLPPALARALVTAGRRQTWRKNQLVLRQGSVSDGLVIGMTGRLRVFITLPSGHETFLRWALPGELMGLPTVLAGAPSPLSILAAGAATSLHIPRTQFMDLLRTLPEAGLAVAVLLSFRVTELFRHIEMGNHNSLADRVWFSLTRLAATDAQTKQSGQRCLRITQSELAMAAGASRQRVHLELQRLQTQGRIALGYGTVTLLP
jgi:CRP-like cAMP-binding protein